MRAAVISRSRPAFALVVVLALLGLVLMLVVAALSVTRQELVTSQQSAEHARARMLAGSATAIAVAQLRSAIEGASGGDGKAAPKPWTSQPGAIRVHGSDGSLETIFKLYSAAAMRASAEAALKDDLAPANWQQRPEHFVDLNAPSHVAAGFKFPILDPRAMDGSESNPVEGFSYQETGAPTGTRAKVKTPDDMRLPMPVRWLYVLEDGTLGTLDDKNGFVCNDPTVVPTRSNPIVGRMAFWVDDESCKINLNTAGEGAFWDTPRADTPQERALAQMQPTRLEYMRHPGHPAGVCLSSFLLPGRRFHPTGFTSEMDDMPLREARELWSIGRLAVAENETGTSLAGRQIPSLLSSTTAHPKPRLGRPPYAELGDVVFDIAKMTGAARSMPVRRLFSEDRAVGKRLLQHGAGFLTTRSAAPETTLYGTPRITLWPVHASTPSPGANTTVFGEGMKRHTDYDQSAVLVSTLNEQRYLVQRSDPGNGSYDLDIHAEGQNKKLLEYLQRLTSRPVPGWTQAGASSFADKYGTDPATGDRDAILISMLDYVRSANFADGQLLKNEQFSILCPGEGQESFGFGQVSPMQPRIVPVSTSATNDHIRGAGRVMTVSEVALVISCAAEVDANGRIQGQPTNRTRLKKPGDREIHVGLLVEGFLPSQGWADYRPYISIALVGGVPGARPHPSDPFPVLKLNGQVLARPSSTAAAFSTVIRAQEDVPTGWRGWGGTLGVRGLASAILSFAPVWIEAPASLPTDADPLTAPDLFFEGGSADGNELKLAVYDSPSSADSPVSNAGDLLHVIPLRFPDIQAAVPNDPLAIKLPRLPVESGVSYRMANRMADSARKGLPLLTREDVVQSLVPAHGDYRLLNARRWEESRQGGMSRPLFAAHPQWGLQRHAHALRDRCLYSAADLAYSQASQGGHFVPGLTVTTDMRPDFPQALNLPVRAWSGQAWTVLQPRQASEALRLDGGVRGAAWPDVTGDFDNGVGNCPDGAYIARPDDGNWAATINGASGGLPYFNPDVFTQLGRTVPPVTAAGFSPQRMLPSPVAFGGLPTGTRAHVPWQTLLFRPDPGGHYGATNPPDHVLLDLFWSPVIEPDIVSVPFETAGKINLNHVLVPFPHIHRATALHAAMKAETLMAIPDSDAGSYKTESPTAGDSKSYRHYIDAAATLSLWQSRVFDRGKVFVTAGQICEHPLVPEGVAASMNAVNNFWGAHRLTGDNSRERPYAHLYPRLTTRSNVFRVHYVVETVKKARSTPANVFVAAKDLVTGRAEGSRIIRRSLDVTNMEPLPDYLAEGTAMPLDMLYQWSVEP